MFHSRREDLQSDRKRLKLATLWYRWIPNDAKRQLLALDDGSGPAECGHVGGETGTACDICGEYVAHPVGVGCSHRWCRSCVRDNIRNSLGQAGSWPPRCCEPFTEDVLARAFYHSRDWAQLWRQAEEEHNTPRDKRVYCSQPTCAEFIPDHSEKWLMANCRGLQNADEDDSSGAAQCLACAERTCRRCKQAAHPGKPCDIEQEDEELMDLMDRERMAGCPQCNRVIQLKDGCNHITCHCGHHWCFLCGGDYDLEIRSCENSCEMYHGKFIPVRDRKKRFRQGRSEEDHKPMSALRNGDELDPAQWGYPLQRFDRQALDHREQLEMDRLWRWLQWRYQLDEGHQEEEGEDEEGEYFEGEYVEDEFEEGEREEDDHEEEEHQEDDHEEDEHEEGEHEQDEYEEGEVPNPFQIQDNEVPPPRPPEALGIRPPWYWRIWFEERRPWLLFGRFPLPPQHEVRAARLRYRERMAQQERPQAQVQQADDAPEPRDLPVLDRELRELRGQQGRLQELRERLDRIVQQAEEARNRRVALERDMRVFAARFAEWERGQEGHYDG